MTTMEVPSSSTHSSKNDINNSGGDSCSNNNYHRSTSIISLASVANSEGDWSVAESFHSCYEPQFGFDSNEEVTATTTMTHRVPSFGLMLEDVMEEDDVPFRNGDSSPSNGSVALPREAPQLISRQSFSKLQRQSLSPHLTAARLALSSDIGLLRKSSGSDGACDRTGEYVKRLSSSSAQHPSMTNAAFPMSRSFATPRAAIGTVFRPTLSNASLLSLHSSTSYCSTKEFDGLPDMMPEDNDTDSDIQLDDQHNGSPVEIENILNSITSISNDTRLFPGLSSPDPTSEVYNPANLNNMARDIQIQVMQFLSFSDVRSLAAVNKRFRRIMFTQDAQLLWMGWCREYDWSQVVPEDSNSSQRRDDLVLVDDLSLPTAARPSKLLHSQHSVGASELSNWHDQANLSLLLSMATQQPTHVDHEQLCVYKSWNGRGGRRGGSRRFRINSRLRTTMDDGRPLLQHRFHPAYEHWVVQFTGRVGRGDRCIRSNRPLPRPTRLTSKDSSWVLAPASPSRTGRFSSSFHNNHSSASPGSGGSNKHLRRASPSSILDLFCRHTRAVSSPRTAWRPFVAPFLSQDSPSAVHLTPRFVSYFEVSIVEPKPLGDEDSDDTTSPRNGTDCVAVGIVTDSFDWHARMPGWDAHSYGYHGDDGGIFHASGGMLRKYGPAYGRGDTVGCGIDHVAGGIFFTLNGEFLGYAWTGLEEELLQTDLYPVVGIDTNDCILTNFGTKPFAFDLTSMCVKHEDLVHQSLCSRCTH